VRLKLDENLPRHLAEHLAGSDHDVDTVGNENLIGADDGAVLEAATVAGRVLVTLDRGLGDRASPVGSRRSWLSTMPGTAQDRSRRARPMTSARLVLPYPIWLLNWLRSK
jgi:hypothetical protein